MNQLKKILLGLAVLVALGASSALAQTTCTANSVPTLVRSQGEAERVGSLVFTCTTGPGASGPATLTVTIQPAAAVITNSPATLPTADVDHAGAIAGVVNGNTVTFTIPGLAAGAHTIVVGTDPSDATATVAIRVNVFASGIVFPSQIATLITSSPLGNLAVTNNFLNVAIPQNGITSTIGTPTPGIAQCGTATLKGTPTTTTIANGAGTVTFTALDPVSGTGKAPTAINTFNVAEGFNSAFEPLAATATAAGEGTDATQGTRVVLTLGTLPSNTVIVAPNYLSTVAIPAVVAANAAGGGTLTLGLVPGADSNGAGGGTPAAPTVGTVTGATLITGTTVTYEVLNSSDATVDNITIPLAIYTIGTPSPAGTTTLSAQLAPISTIGTPIVTPIPRFGASPTSGNFFVVVPCLTNVFIPWAANTAGYDTGFAIANTTTDIFGSSSQSGTCVYNFFGTNTPSGGTFTTPAFGGGAVDTRLLSAVAPGFFGYIIVQCNFQLGHGFEFIVNGFGGGTPTVGEGGPALIIPQPATTGTGAGSRKAAASAFGAAGAGEVLGH